MVHQRHAVFQNNRCTETYLGAKRIQNSWWFKKSGDHQFVDRLSHYLQGFIHHPRWFGISEPSTESILYLGLSPLPVTVTSRIVMFLVWDPYKPLFATATGRGDNPNYICLARKQFITTVRIIPQLYFTRSCPSILAGRSCECPWGVLLHPNKMVRKVKNQEDGSCFLYFFVANRSIWPNGIIFHQPRFPWNKGSHFPYFSPPFGGPIGRVRSRVHIPPNGRKFIDSKVSGICYHGNLRIPPQCHPPQAIRPY